MFDPTFFYLAYLSLYISFSKTTFSSYLSNVDKSCPSQINYALLLGDTTQSWKSVICLSFFRDYLYPFHFSPFQKLVLLFFPGSLFPFTLPEFPSFPYCFLPGSLLSVPFFLSRPSITFFTSCSRSVPYSEFLIPRSLLPPVPYFPVSYLQFLCYQLTIPLPKSLFPSSLSAVPYVFGVIFPLLVPALQGKSHLCIPFLGIARPQSQFPQSCVSERSIYSQDWSTYFPAAK